MGLHQQAIRPFATPRHPIRMKCDPDRMTVPANVTVHHSHASHLLTNAVPVHIVAARLGHASPMVTMSVYAHVLPRSDELAAALMADVVALAGR